MPTRRDLLRSASLAAAPALAGCDGDDAYARLAHGTWQLPATPPEAPLLKRELVRCATLAPSSHNTQCWRFRIGERRIDILPDLARRCPAVDPDDHHLHVSLGCAAENLVQSALHHGLHAQAMPAAGGGVAITLEATTARSTPLYRAIAQRQSSRGEYDGRPLSTQELAQLEQAGSGHGVRVLMVTGRAAMEQVLALVLAGNTAQMRDPAFVAELKAWIRFSPGEAARSGDGLYTACTGNPTLPRWLGSPMFELFFTPDAENDKYSRQIRSSAGLAVFVSELEDAAHWIETGRCAQRFALQATAQDIRTAFVNQPVEVAALRPQLAGLLGIGTRRPDLVVRFGRGPRLPVSLRRPLAAVIDAI